MLEKPGIVRHHLEDRERPRNTKAPCEMKKPVPPTPRGAQTLTHRTVSEHKGCSKALGGYFVIQQVTRM